jgi:hypothetical protein
VQRQPGVIVDVSLCRRSSSSPQAAQIQSHLCPLLGAPLCIQLPGTVCRLLGEPSPPATPSAFVRTTAPTPVSPATLRAAATRLQRGFLQSDMLHAPPLDYKAAVYAPVMASASRCALQQHPPSSITPSRCVEVGIWSILTELTRNQVPGFQLLRIVSRARTLCPGRASCSSYQETLLPRSSVHLEQNSCSRFPNTREPACIRSRSRSHQYGR